MTDTKTCKICGEIKPFSAFHPNSSCRDGLYTFCKICRTTRYWKKHEPNKLITEKFCRLCQQTLPIQNFTISRNKKDGWNSYCKLCCKKKFAVNTLLGRFKQWKAQAKYKQIPFLLTEMDINQRPLICHYTGIELTLLSDHYNTISLDRLDSSKNYTSDNVVLCCEIVNRMKMELSSQQFFTLCETIVNYTHLRHKTNLTFLNI